MNRDIKNQCFFPPTSNLKIEKKKKKNDTFNKFAINPTA